MARCRSESCRPFTTYAYADYVLAWGAQTPALV